MAKRLTHAQQARKILGSTAEQVSNGAWQWSKRGGHPNKTIERIREKLEHAGFKRVEARSIPHQPDSITHGEIYQHRDGRMATISRFYGQVAWDNHFSITIKEAL